MRRLFLRRLGDGSQLQEHSCAAVNGCNGLSCVYTAEGEGRTGQEVFEYTDFPTGAPIACGGCHRESVTDAAGNSSPDPKSFKLYLRAGSTRNASNWLQLPEAAQQAIVAFGKQTIEDDGTPIASMAGYHRLLSREEIIAVVKYVRTLTPTVHTIRVNDTPGP